MARSLLTWQMAQAIRSHVQACFDREADLLDALDAGTYDTEMLDTGWLAPDLPKYGVDV